MARMILTCKNCSIEFEVTASRQRPYCSRACYGKSLIGKPSWNAGKKGYTNAGSFTKGHIGIKANLGKKLSPEVRQKMSIARKGTVPWVKGKKVPSMSGPNHYLWKGGITPESKKERSRFLKYMRKKVFERDSYTCTFCFTRGETLHVDHIKSWAEFPELRFQLENCRTLCRRCHFEITFGYPMPEESTWGLIFRSS